MQEDSHSASHSPSVLRGMARVMHVGDQKPQFETWLPWHPWQDCVKLTTGTCAPLQVAGKFAKCPTLPQSFMPTQFQVIRRGASDWRGGVRRPLVKEWQMNTNGSISSPI